MNRQQLLRQMACLGLAVLLLAGCGGAQVEPTTTPTPLPTISTATRTPVPPTPMRTLEGQQALFVLYELFEEQEYGEPRAILEDKGVIITVASSSLDVLTGHQGMEVQPNVVLSDVRAADYAVIVFIGGYRYNRDDPEAQRIAQEAVAEGKLLAAICVAPITLAKAGVVEGKRVTASMWISQLEEAGAIFAGGPVQRDGLIITANGPDASRQFGEAIAAALEE